MLAKVLFWLCAALAAGLGLCVMYAKRQTAVAAKYKNKATENERVINSLKMIIDRMKVEAAIKSDNRKEADEKVEKLHSGDAAANALDQLCKQQG